MGAEQNGKSCDDAAVSDANDEGVIQKLIEQTTDGCDKEKVLFEDILKLIGDSGRWQFSIFLLLCIEGVLIGCSHFSSIYLAASMNHWCNVTNVNILQQSKYSHWTDEQRKEYLIPKSADGQYESCKMYNLHSSPTSSFNAIPTQFETALSLRPNNLDTIGCRDVNEVIPLDEAWIFDKKEGIVSIVTDWSLVCERLPLLSTVQGSYMGGVFVGCFVFGWASDKFGRRPTILVASVIQIVTNIVTSFSVNYIMFVFFRFLVAFSVSGVFECGFVLVTEICGPHFRAPFGILTQLPFGLGATFLTLLAYFIRDWQTLQLFTALPCLLLTLYYWFIPESPRWLLGEGRVDEAMTVLKAGAKRNNKHLPNDEEFKKILEKFSQQEKEDEALRECGQLDIDEESANDENNTELKEISVAKSDEESRAISGSRRRGPTSILTSIFKEFIMLFGTPEMRKRSLNVVFSWFVVAMTYYGLSFNSKNLAKNRYVTNFVAAFVEVPAVIVILPLLTILGRSKCYCWTFISGGVCCGLVALISIATKPGEMTWLPVTFAMLGKFLISMTFAIAYLYTAELFPTKVRNLAVGAASTFARVGSMIAPYIVDLLGVLHPSIPVVIFGIFSTSAGLLSLMLPETLNKKMPESVADIEQEALEKQRIKRRKSMK